MSANNSADTKGRSTRKQPMTKNKRSAMPRSCSMRFSKFILSSSSRATGKSSQLRYGNTLFSYRGECLMQGVEDVIGADDVGQAVAVQIGPQRRLCVHEH